MKRLNLILVSDTEPTATESVPAEKITLGGEEVATEVFTPDMIDENLMSQLTALDGQLEMYPALAKDPDIQNLMKIKASMEAAAKGAAPAQETTTTVNEKGETVVTPVSTTAVDNPLSALPFFKSDGNASSDFSKATVQNLPEIAKNSFGLDTTKADWLPTLLTQVASAKEATDKYESVNSELIAFKEDLEKLPKEIQAAVVLYADGKDWRTALNIGSQLDYTKDFTTLTPEEQVNIHNFYFPEDKIETGADIKDKSVSKSISAAAAKFNADKTVVSTTQQRQQEVQAANTKAFQDSISTSIGNLKKAYPDYKDQDFKNIENLIKTKGIMSLFHDDKGNLLPDAAEKLSYALNGKNILQAAVAIAEGRGKSKGKADVLATVGTRGGGTGDTGKELTDDEKALNGMLADSMQTLTY